MKRRIFSFLMALVLIAGLLPQPVWAAEDVPGVCPNHPKHDGTCGYVETVPEKPCGHTHGEECRVTQCLHVHEAACYPEGNTEAEPVCGHVCTLESGCITCGHVHDNACGYQAAVPGNPCGHSCETCNPPVCSCETPCVEGAVNSGCPVCAGDAAKCAKKAPETSLSEGAPTCDCTAPCAEGAVKTDCPVCGASWADCSQKPVFSDGLNQAEGSIQPMITLAQNEIHLTEGGEWVKLEYTVVPEGAEVTIESENSNFVAVEPDGFLRPVSRSDGPISVFVRLVDDSYVWAVCQVFVDDPTVPVDGIMLDQKEVTLEVDGVVTLTATVTPDNATDSTVTWSSDQEGVATVAGGIVTAVAPGTAVITARAGDKTATCTVTVSEPQPDPVAIVNGVGYATIVSALSDAKTNGGSMTLLQNADATIAFTVNKPLTLNMNGHTLFSMAIGINSVSADLTVTGGGIIKLKGVGLTASLTVEAGATLNGGTTEFTGAVKANGTIAGGYFSEVTGSGTITGGYFKTKPNQAMLANGYMVEQVEGGYPYHVVPMPVVATINGVGYTRLQDAITAAGKTDTIKLLQDCEYPSYCMGDFKFDLNNHHLNLTDGLSAFNLTLTGPGTLSSTNGISINTVLNATDDCVIEGNVTNRSTIAGGNFTGTVSLEKNMNSGISTKITGGIFAALNVETDSTISGGYFDTIEETGGTLSITGGYFKNKPAAGIATGYAAVESGNAEYPYQVVPMPVVAKVGDTDYYNIDDAFDAVAEGGTIALLADVTNSGIAEIRGSVTVEMNGHTLTLGQGKEILVSGTLITTGSGSIVNPDGDAKILVCGGGTLSLAKDTQVSALVQNKGTIAGGTYTGYLMNNSLITGGYFSGTVDGQIQGGYFKEKPESVPQGYAIMNSGNSDYFYTVVAKDSEAYKNAVAETGGVCYTTFQSAVDACPVGGTVKLLTGVEAVAIPDSITVDLNAEQLTIPEGLTISGGTFMDSQDHNAIVNYGIIEDGTFMAPVINGPVEEGVPCGEIKGGSFTSVINYRTISGGEIEKILYNYGDIIGGTVGEIRMHMGTISGGTFTGTVTCYAYDGIGNGVVTGGTFREDGLVIGVAEEDIRAGQGIAEGYGKSDTVDGYFRVVHVAHGFTWTAEGATLTGKCTTCGETITAALTAPADLTYDGQPKEAALTTTGNWGTVQQPTITYTGNTTGAGDVTASITMDGKTASVTYTIGKAALTLEGVKTVDGKGNLATNFTYGDTFTLKVTPKSKASVTGTLTLMLGENQLAAMPVTVNQEMEFTVDTKALGAGSKTLTLSFSGDSNAADNSVTATVTVAQADMTPTLTGYAGTYDGKAHDAVTLAGVPQGAKVEYSTDGGQTFSDAMPTFTDAGEAKCKVRITCPNYKEWSKEVAVKIGKKTVDFKAWVVEGKTPTMQYNSDTGYWNMEQDDAVEFDLIGIVSGGNFSTRFDFDSKNVGTGKTLTGVVTLGDDLFKNHAFADGSRSATVVLEGVGTITPKPLNAIIKGVASKVYDGTTYCTNLAVSLEWLNSKDDVDYTSTFAYDKADAGDRTVTATVTLTGADAGNYALPDSITANGIITKAQLGTDVTASIPDAIYLPGDQPQVTLKLGDTELPLDDYTLAYQDGEITVTAKENTNFEGTLTVTYTVTPPVAQIGDKQYPTLEEAIEDAKPGDTVTVVDGEKVGDVVIDKDLTLDLGGETITGDVTIKNDVIIKTPGDITGTITVTEDGSLTTDGTLSGDIINNGTIGGGTFTGEIDNNGTIKDGDFSGGVTNEGTIEGGNFTGDIDNNGTIKDGDFSGNVTNEGTIEDGNFTGEIDNNGTIEGGDFSGNVTNNDTIEGGTFTGDIDNNGTIKDGDFSGNVTNEGTIEDGTFTGDIDNNGTIKDGTFTGETTNNGTIEGGGFSGNVTGDGDIKGGTFEQLPENIDQNSGVINKDGEYVVVSKDSEEYQNAEAELDGIRYPTFQDAVDNAKPGDTITLINDVSPKQDQKITIDKDITVDCNGKTLDIGNGTISDGHFKNGIVISGGTISGGVFETDVTNKGAIQDGYFQGTVTNDLPRGEVTGGYFMVLSTKEGAIGVPAPLYGSTDSDKDGYHIMVVHTHAYAPVKAKDYVNQIILVCQLESCAEIHGSVTVGLKSTAYNNGKLDAKLTFKNWPDGVAKPENIVYTPASGTENPAKASIKMGEVEVGIQRWIVTFDSNGGTAVPATAVVDETAITAPTQPTRANYEFKGWYQDEALTIPWTFQTKTRAAADTVEGNLTLYAKWAEIFTLTFEDNTTAKVTNMPENEDIVDGENQNTTTIPTEKPKRYGYSFSSWNTQRSGKGDKYKPGDEITLHEDVTLYAQWKQADMTNGKTGDYILIAVTVLALSGAALAGLLVYSKKKKK